MVPVSAPSGPVMVGGAGRERSVETEGKPIRVLKIASIPKLRPPCPARTGVLIWACAVSATILVGMAVILFFRRMGREGDAHRYGPACENVQRPVVAMRCAG